VASASGVSAAVGVAAVVSTVASASVASSEPPPQADKINDALSSIAVAPAAHLFDRIVLVLCVRLVAYVSIAVLVLTPLYGNSKVIEVHKGIEIGTKRRGDCQFCKTQLASRCTLERDSHLFTR
jgi:hypothetical protein